MSKIKFIEQLRATAAELEPLTKSTLPGAMTWNGSEYVKNVGEANAPDPYALAWWSTLTTIADLIEAQETQLTDKQFAYLNRVLFGGMGSLADLSFNSKSVNEGLNKSRQLLFESFKDKSEE